MKTVGKQLEEARLAKNWTPELASRETKIKVDRLRDLEADDYSHFTSPTYARGFVRTYARSLGLDEYKILRQLDNKLPDDDGSNIVTDSGVAYLPESSMPPRVAHRNYTGLYIVMMLGGAVMLVIAFVLFEAYRVGDLQRYFAPNPEPTASSTASNLPPVPESETPPQALPLDTNTAPPIVDTTTGSLKALPVNPADLANGTNSESNSDIPANAPKALPVNPSDLNAAVGSTNQPGTITPPRALPVDPQELAAAASPSVTPTPSPPPLPAPSISARQSNTRTLSPTPAVTPLPVAAVTNAPPMTNASDADKRLVLTATQDSFVRVTALNGNDSEKPLYAAVLHGGQSVGFDGHKFSINVGVPSAVDIKLDGVNYGPHSDQQVPETFTVESHQP